MNKIVVFLIVLLSFDSVAEDASICPSKLEVGEWSPSAPHFVEKTSKLNLFSVNFYIGHPAEKSLLKVDEGNSKRKNNTVEIKLGAGYQYWVTCHYSKFDYYLVFDLGKSTYCHITYSDSFKDTDEKGRPLLIVESFKCV